MNVCESVNVCPVILSVSFVVENSVKFCYFVHFFFSVKPYIQRRFSRICQGINSLIYCVQLNLKG